MIVLDTTVLVYAVGAEHPLREPARQLVQAVGSGRLRATTTVEVIQEFTHVRARRRPRSDAAAVARDYVNLLSPLISLDGLDVEHGLAMYERSNTIGAFDAFLAAAVIRQDHLSTLVSADRGFASIEPLDFRNLADHDALAPLLAGS